MGVLLLAVAALAVTGCTTKQSRFEKKPPASTAAASAPVPAATPSSPPTTVPVGLAGDVLPGSFAPASALTDTVGSLLADIAKEAKVAFYPSTLSRERGLLGRRVTVPAGSHALNTLVDRLCRDAAISCFFTTDYRAIAAYDPRELEPHREDIVISAHSIDPAEGGGARASRTAAPIRVVVPKPIRRPAVPVDFAEGGAAAPALKAP